MRSFKFLAENGHVTILSWKIASIPWIYYTLNIIMNIIFNLGEKIKEYQQNYFEHILRMPTYWIPWKIFNYHPKGRRDKRLTTNEIDGSIHLTRRSEQVNRPKPSTYIHNMLVKGIFWAGDSYSPLKELMALIHVFILTTTPHPIFTFSWYTSMRYIFNIFPPITQFF
jgi:hypothetical protein